MSDLTKLAELIRPDDSMRFKLFAQKVIVQEDARITVEVHSLVSTSNNDHKALEQKIRDALNNFIKADWAFSTIKRGGEAVGYECVTLNASTRIPVSEVYNLEERARQASTEGLSLKEPQINYSIPSARVTETVQELRMRIIEDAIVTGRPHTSGDGERQNPGVPLACPPFGGWRTAASINQQGGCMHHKRKRYKNARAGCLLCKPNKMNGWAKHRVWLTPEVMLTSKLSRAILPNPPIGYVTT